MRHEDQCRRFEQQLFELLDAGDVQVVGGLIEQQQVRFQRQGERQRRALALAAGGPGGVDRTVDLESRRELDQPGLASPAPPLVDNVFQSAALPQTLEQRVRRRQLGFLLDVDDAQPVAPLHFTSVERDAAGHDAQQGRFASAVAANQTNAITLVQRAGRLIEERCQPVSEFSVKQCQ